MQNGLHISNGALWATRVGEFVGWVLLAAGISTLLDISLPWFGAGLVAGLLLTLTGWFLMNAHTERYRGFVIRDPLAKMHVTQLMSTRMPTVPPNIPVSCLVNDHILVTSERSFPVIDGGRLVGLICLQDVCKVPHEEWDLTEVGEIMTPASQLATAKPGDQAGDALDDLVQRDVNQLPVVQDGRLVGMLRRCDIVNCLQSHSAFSVNHKRQV